MSEEITFAFNVDTEKLSGNIRKLEIIVLRVMSITRTALKMYGASEDTQKALENAQRLISASYALYAAIRLVQGAMGPIGWLYAGVSVVTAGMGVLEATQGR